MEEVTRCSYIDCLDTREKEQILHELPVCDTGLCVKWLVNSGHVDLIGRDFDSLRSMKFFICNNHFTDDCYLSKGTLKESAVPSPHWSANTRTSAASKARQEKLQKEESGEAVIPRLAVDQEKARESIVSELPDRNDRLVRTTRSSARLTRSALPGLPVGTSAPIDAVDASHWCRTCATKKQDLVSMTTNSKTSEMSLLSKLKLLIEIDDEDALPTKMCDECVLKLEQSFKFFQQIYIADNTLRQLFPRIGPDGRDAESKRGFEEQKKEKRPAEEKRPRGRGRGRGRGRPRKDASYRSVDTRLPASPKQTWRRGGPRRGLVDRSIIESIVEKREPSPVLEDTKGTVFSLLTDTCRSDEELDWADVLKLMNQDPSTKPGDEFSIEPGMESRTEPASKSTTEPAVKATEPVIQPKVEPGINSTMDSAMDSTMDTTMDTTMESAMKSVTEEAVKMPEESESERTVLPAMEETPIAGPPVEITMKPPEDVTIKPLEKSETTDPICQSSVESGVRTVNDPNVAHSIIQSRIEPGIESGSGPMDDSTTEPDGDINCEFCDAVFRLRRQLRTHLLSNHPEETTYMCSECLACYHNESLLVRHRALRHNEKFFCDHCSHKFHQKIELAEHVFKCHPPAKRYYSCDACGDTFASKRVLIVHVTSSCTVLTNRLQEPPESQSIVEKSNGNLESVDRIECGASTGIANGVTIANIGEQVPQADVQSKMENEENKESSSASVAEPTGRRMSKSLDVEEQDDDIPDTSKRRRTSPP